MSVNGILALIEKAKQSLNAAQSLIRDGYFDFAASRAYYAMFYIAEALLLFLNQSYSKHSAVISAFGREFSKTGKMDPKFHRWLIDAQDFRNIGDYGIETHVTEAQAHDVCTWSDAFINAAEIYLETNKPNG